MQVPSLFQTQAHLRELGFTLERIEDPSERLPKYRLLNSKGRDWGTFDSLNAFWSFWLDYASKVLYQGQIVEAFVEEFRSADTQRRSEIVDWYEGWLTNKSPEPYERFLGAVEPLDPDNLPKGWQSMLKDNLTGWVGGRRATRCMVEKMAEIDERARARLRELPAKCGVPELQLVD